ncbi:MAG: type VI secretion system tip protein VgrG [Phycisphaerales bacterium]|nr:type VI secretion system tip protein VgrG [Phycisphaerales bacterium]
MAPFQAQRELSLITPSLGEDVLLLESFSYAEEFGQPFWLTVRAKLSDPAADVYSLVGKSISVKIRMLNEEDRSIVALVRGVSEPGTANAQRIWTLTCSPRAWLASLTTNCKIFQNKTVPDIIKAVLGKHKVKIDDRLTESYREWKYCVQYRETDLNFVTRLMEQEGITYHFLHQDEDTLVLCDSTSSIRPLKHYKEITFHDPDSGLVFDDVTSFSVSLGLQSESVVFDDYDFKVPTKELKKSAKVDFPHVAPATEQYDYPGEYWEPGDGDGVTKRRAEDIATGAQVYSGTAKCRGLYCGGKFALKDPTIALRSGLEREYTITSCSITGQNDSFASGGKSPGSHVETNFTAIHADRVYRPARTTRKPLIVGPQTAVVVGPGGEEIHTDEHARVKVQFHWDRDGQMDENSSCWVRVSQAWAGKSWGSVVLPRIGDEVIVEFAEGDPDRPIITGRLYNNDNKSPFKMPDSKNTLGMKSSSSKGGGGYNEISMDDSKGKEKVTIHGQYDMSTTVKHDQTNTINNNRTTNVDVDDTETIGSNQTITVGSNQDLQVGASQSIQIGANQTLQVGAGQTNEIGADQKTTVGANASCSVGSNYELIAGSSTKITAGGQGEYKTGGPMKIGAGATMEIAAGGAMEIKAASIKISAGAGTIEIGPAGVTISGPKVEVTAGIIKNNG